MKTFQDRISCLLKYELYAIMIATLAAMASQSLLIVAIGVSVIFWTIRLFGQPRAAWRVATPVDLAMVGLWLMLPITWWVTIDHAITGWQILRLVNGIALFYAVVRWLSAEISVVRLYQTFVALAAMGIFVVVMGLVSTKWPVGKSRGFDYLYSYLTGFSTASIHPNVLAGTIILFLPISIVCLVLPWVVQWRQGHRLIGTPYTAKWSLFHATATIFMAIGLLLTQSRGALLGMIVAILIILFVIGSQRLRFSFCIGIAMISVLGFVFPNTFVILISQFTSDSAISTGSIRLEIWSRAYYIVQDFPFTGIGMGNFQRVVEGMYPLLLTTEIIPHAHNLFLQIADDLGLIGFVCWLAIAMSTTIGLCAVIKRDALHLQQSLSLARYLMATGLLGSQAALLTHGLVDAVTWGGVRTAPFVWMLWGTATALTLHFSAADAAH